MGLLDRWLKRHLAPEKSISSDGPTGDDPVADVAQDAFREDTLSVEQRRQDEEIRKIKSNLTLDEAGHAYALGHLFQRSLAELDAQGRSKAADSILAEAILVAPSAELKKRLAERLLHRGEREKARTLLEQLARTKDQAIFALRALAELSERAGDIGLAKRYYERVLALDISDEIALKRASRMREHSSAHDGRAAKERARLARFLGARAAGSRYAVVEEVGRGGAATVFRASDRAVGREVALKIFHPKGRAEQRRARLVQEARIAGAFDHPHIVPILDIDQTRDLLVMMLCEGGSLAERLREGKLSILETAELGNVLLTTLADIHEQGQSHLDIKPSNLLFHEGRMMLCDFGTAGLLQMGMAAGTRAYMAPEQKIRAKVSPKADIYSTALVLMECLTGQLPQSKRSGADLVLESLQPGPRRNALEALLSEMLEVDEKLRPDDARGLAQRLLEAAALPQTDSEGQKLWERLSKMAEGHGPEAQNRLRNHPLRRFFAAP